MQWCCGELWNCGLVFFVQEHTKMKPCPAGSFAASVLLSVLSLGYCPRCYCLTCSLCVLHMFEWVSSSVLWFPSTFEAHTAGRLGTVNAPGVWLCVDWVFSPCTEGYHACPQILHNHDQDEVLEWRWRWLAELNCDQFELICGLDSTKM